MASVAIIPTEGLAVAVADEIGRGPVTAGLLTAAVPAGFVLASFFVLRTPSARREAMLPALVLLSAVPLLASPFVEAPGALLVVWVVAGAGGTANLIAGPAFVQSCPPQMRGRAYGVATAVLMTSQGIGLLLSGWLGNVIAPRAAVATVAALTLAVALPVLGAQGTRQTIRNVRQGSVPGEGRS
jgi:MFS family permease